MNGLNYNEVNERIQKGQINTSAKDISKTKKQIVFEHVFTYFNGLNLFLAMMIVFSGRYINLTFIGVVFFNTIIGIIQELKVKKTIDELSIVMDQSVLVRRNGQDEIINSDELVLDDVYTLKVGTQIPCDSVVLDGYFEVNEALLTGESKPVKKVKGTHVFAGTFVTSGSGMVKAEKVGDDNYSSELLMKVKKKNNATSEMKDAIEKVIKVLSIIIVPVGLMLFRAQYNANADISDAIVKTVAGVVGMIPEGLVLLTSVSFVLGVGRLAKKQALVQQMESIEALSRVDTLCLDKTGTITTGELRVNNTVIFYDLGYDDQKVNEVMSAFVDNGEEGNMTQAALRQYFHEEHHLQSVKFIPFSSDRKFQAVTYDNGCSYVLGAPEYLTTDTTILKLVADYSYAGYRVLMLGEASRIHRHKETYDDFVPMALIVISDIIKEDAKDTFAFFEKEGVDIKVLSGDNPITVSRVCMMAGLKKGDRYIDASKLPDDIASLSKIIDDYQVFGRVKPEQKELIIQALQKKEHIVAMVGDGVNDVLAIKESDCGIAMANGADAAKHSAHIVLLDSQFSSMKDIFKEGRTIVANIEKVSALYLTKTIYSTGLSLIFSLIGKAYPFTPFQLSIISSFAIGYPSFFITLEKDVDMQSKGFLRHVLNTALPCGLSIIFYVLLSLFMTSYLSLNMRTFNTLSYYMTVLVSFIVLYKVCLPLNKYRKAIFGICSVCVVVALVFLSKYLSIYSLFDFHSILVIPLALSSFIMTALFTNIINKMRLRNVIKQAKKYFV